MGCATRSGSAFTERLLVGVGDLSVSANPNIVLSTYALGSCVAVVALDPVVQVGGLAHIMLPDSRLSPEDATRQPAMFADSGVDALLSELGKLKADLKRLKILLAGGANVISSNHFFKLGERNCLAVKEALNEHGLAEFQEDLGGLNNRTLHFKIGEGLVEMKVTTGTRTISLA